MAGSLNLGHVVGPAGQGIASGGTTGQYLKKASSTDYDTAWASFANATQSAAGMMSATDKAKLDGLPASAAKPDAIAIIVDGDTAGMAVAPEQYAYVKNNTHGLAEGLYKNKSSSAFPTSGGTADSTVFEAVSGGGINAITNQIAKQDVSDYFQNLVGLIAHRVGNIVTFTGSVTRQSLSIYQQYQGTATIIKSGLRPSGIITLTVMRGTRGTPSLNACGYVNSEGLLVLFADSDLTSVSSDTSWYIGGTYAI